MAGMERGGMMEGIIQGVGGIVGGVQEDQYESAMYYVVDKLKLSVNGNL